MRGSELFSRYVFLDYPSFSAVCKICHATVSTASDRFFFPVGETPLEKHLEWHREQERLRTSSSI